MALIVPIIKTLRKTIHEKNPEFKNLVTPFLENEDSWLAADASA
jgi:hypothetical protein